MKVLVTGKQDPRVLLALAALGAEVALTTDSTVEITPREITGVWRGELVTLSPEKQRSYGPLVKGRGGKVKRW